MPAAKTVAIGVAALCSFAADVHAQQSEIVRRQRWASRTSTAMIRGGKYGMASGRARKIANAWASTTTVIQTFLI
jgi:hypothetical protein